jgi:hypothetical protein
LTDFGLLFYTYFVLTNPQMTGLLELVLAQQREIYDLKSLVYALAHVAREVAGPNTGDRILELQKKFREAPQIHNCASTIELIEKAVLQLKHQTDPVN